MERKGVKMAFKPNELIYFLLGKKSCPYCGKKLKRITKKNFCGKEVTVMTAPLDMYEYKIFYYCDCCQTEYSLTELCEREKNEI